MNNVFVYCEIDQGKIAEVSLELLTKGRALADEVEGKGQLEPVVAALLVQVSEFGLTQSRGGQRGGRADKGLMLGEDR